MTIEIRERTLQEKLMWYAAFIEDAKTSTDLVAAVIQLPPLLREAADALTANNSPEARREEDE